jgi:hypothetical protein
MSEQSAKAAQGSASPAGMIKAALACFALSALGLGGGLTGLELEQNWLTYGGFALCVGAGLAAHVLAIWGWVRLPRSQPPAT